MYGFGKNLNKLVKGYDCPSYATYLDTDFNPESLCIFERDAGFPISRHTSENWTSVAKNNILVVRTISTISNYDYILDYQFYYDGSVEVTVRASGYIEGTNSGGNEEYGYRIHNALSGAMHDHVLNFKLDLDVNGTANTLQRVDIKPITAAIAGGETPSNTMKIERHFIQNEDQGKINWAPNAASQYIVVNKDAPNPWGELRGYRIAPGYGSPIHLTPINSTIAGATANFATHHLYVTKRKDTEPSSSSRLNIMDNDDPYIDFARFFNSENIEQEDVVLWFNLGMHHVPQTGYVHFSLLPTKHDPCTCSE